MTDADSMGVRVMRALRNGTGPEMAYWSRRNDEHERPWTAGKEAGTWYPEPVAEQMAREARFGREIAAMLGIGLDRPPEDVFEHFRRLHALDAMTTIPEATDG